MHGMVACFVAFVVSTYCVNLYGQCTVKLNGSYNEKSHHVSFNSTARHVNGQAGRADWSLVDAYVSVVTWDTDAVRRCLL